MREGYASSLGGWQGGRKREGSVEDTWLCCGLDVLHSGAWDASPWVRGRGWTQVNTLRVAECTGREGVAW